MLVNIEVKGVPPHHRRYVVARLFYGQLRFYSSYSSEDVAKEVVDRLQNATWIDAEGL